jgi:hypothetical protein
MQTERTLPELTRDLAGQLGDLFRNEARLARAETMENIRDLGGAMIRVLVGAALAGAAVTMALMAVAFGLGESVPMWAAALVSALIGAVAAYLLIQSGRKALTRENITLPRTASNVSRDLQMIKENVKP